MEQANTDRFPMTQRSVVDAIQSDDPTEKSRAIEAITAAYWKPIYKYFRLRWKVNFFDAQDLTQEFFARLIEKDFLSSYDVNKGRLRTFLRTCADRLFMNQSRDAHRMKRGGANPDANLDFDEAERELARMAPSSSDTIDEYFEREWIRNLFALALERLRSKFTATGKLVYLDLFERYDLAEDQSSRLTYAQLAEEFRVSASNVTNYLAAARREFRQCVLDQLREMTTSEEEYQAEARALLGTRTK
jgi:RNA polymerase sigma factor (sigma-70 family)